MLFSALPVSGPPAGRDDVSAPERAETRTNSRTNMFLGAVLRGAGLCAPVKIRNMSPTGALVEGALIPESGSAVELLRGSLIVSGIVAWREDGRCGLRFSSLVAVAEWLAPPSNGAQQRIDDTVRLLKLGALPMSQRASAEAPASAPPRSVQFGEDLLGAARLIENFGDRLASDVEMLVRHSDLLQDLEIALQTIHLVAEVLGGRADELAAPARMENLRSSCAAALGKLGKTR
jgi:hypothetical protein